MEKITLVFDRDTLNIILKNLGQGPFIEVNNIIANIQSQARAQVSPPIATSPEKTNGTPESEAEKEITNDVGKGDKTEKPEKPKEENTLKKQT